MNGERFAFVSFVLFAQGLGFASLAFILCVLVVIMAAAFLPQRRTER